ncbi:hypothetical protein GCM10009715_27180 [Paeniglutamicibacter psychrophenolicus]|uniref:DUF3099 domain-containing protein n=1 Tax=Paeniglutamicibacter psychrophenolicus TaxID=257454 RepID=A0ABS4WEM5_9MICC|nr:DUF3099 domain-containing protein [Paeniglutamicibacter psychrophenolicus]MBP2374670.1 hypothetical protein [Paeniglutamicibacter psychrophenolicus]
MSEPHKNHHHHDQGPPVHRITEAQESHAAEQHSRVLKYTISMSVRLACFIAAFFVHGWLQWVFLAAAIVLPYIAVVIANGGADLTKRQPAAEFFEGDDPRLLTSGPTAPEGEPTAADAPGAPGARPADATTRDGDVFEVNEDGEVITEPAANPEAGHPAPSAREAQEPDAAGPFPADAPTTIDGSFVEEPERPEQPLAGHHHRGGSH